MFSNRRKEDFGIKVKRNLNPMMILLYLGISFTWAHYRLWHKKSGGSTIYKWGFFWLHPPIEIFYWTNYCLAWIWHFFHVRKLRRLVKKKYKR